MAELGERLWEARNTGSLIERDAVLGFQGRDDAYAVQASAVRASGLTRAGWKVAATSPMAQTLLGMSSPSIGPVFAEHLYEPGASLVARPEHGAAIECEIAFTLAETLPKAIDITRDALLAAVEQARIAVELVGCRFAGGFAGAGALACISDFSFNAALVAGAVIDGWRDIDMTSVGASVFVNGNKVNEGTGTAVLGDPVDALRWAANEAARIGMPFKAGDIITTGTMTGVSAVKPGDQVVGDFGPLGRIDLNFMAA